MFRGISNLTLDAKGRLAVPARYRERIQEACRGQLVVTIDRDHCLLIYPLPEWEALEERLVRLPSLNKEARELQRLLLGHATEVELDSHVRLLLPPELRAFAGLERDVVLLGLGRKFELWQQANWDTRREASLAGDADRAGGRPAGRTRQAGALNAPVAHRPVLLKEAVDALAVQADGVYLDGTFGRGGHSREILARLGPKGRLLALDRDPEAHAAARALAATDSRLVVYRATFSQLERVATEAGVGGRVNGVLLDIGVSSAQLDDARRGFSFTQKGPLDMRMDPDAGESAADWLMRAPEPDIARVIHEYGEERHARRIARAIVAARATEPLTDTLQLAEIVSRAVPRHDRHKHPATRTFQAIRIFINRELEELSSCLAQCLKVLAPAGRLAVISFHSLEDRMVKRFIRDHARLPEPDPKAPWIEPTSKPLLRAVGKALQAGEAEVAENPRARSAVLRVAEKLP